LVHPFGVDLVDLALIVEADPEEAHIAAGKENRAAKFTAFDRASPEVLPT
jgi:hypothetical protein